MKRNLLVPCLMAMMAAAIGCSEPAEQAKSNADGAANNGVAVAQAAAADSQSPKARTFELTYGATLTGLDDGAEVKVWIPVPQSTADQTVEALESKLPAKTVDSTDSTYGNRMKFFEVKADGDVTFNTAYRIQRKEVRGLDQTSPDEKLEEPKRKQFLAGNSKVPLAGKQLDLLQGVTFSDEPIEIARSLYNKVDQHVKYDKSKPGYGNGDVLWVCDSRTGNCTDFHSLFISWSRSKGIPARFEIGFPLPPERGEGAIGGYHCWAMFHTKKLGWVPVDISEADKHPEMKDYYFGNLTEDRVSFSVGRDIVLSPKQSGPPLNYFVYPYVEVDGKPLGKEQIKLQFSYRDVKP